MHTPKPLAIRLNERLHKDPRLTLLQQAASDATAIYSQQMAVAVTDAIREMFPDADSLTIATDLGENEPVYLVKIHAAGDRLLWFADMFAHHSDVSDAITGGHQRVHIDGEVVGALNAMLNGIFDAHQSLFEYIDGDTATWTEDDNTAAFTLHVTGWRDWRPFPVVAAVPEVGGVYWLDPDSYELMFAPNGTDGLPDMAAAGPVDYNRADGVLVGYARAAESRLRGDIPCPQMASADQLRQLVGALGDLVKDGEAHEGGTHHMHPHDAISLLGQMIDQARWLLTPKVWIYPQHWNTHGTFCGASSGRASGPKPCPHGCPGGDAAQRASHER